MNAFWWINSFLHLFRCDSGFEVEHRLFAINFSAAVLLFSWIIVHRAIDRANSLNSLLEITQTCMIAVDSGLEICRHSNGTTWFLLAARHHTLSVRSAASQQQRRQEHEMRTFVFFHYTKVSACKRFPLNFAVTFFRRTALVLFGARATVWFGVWVLCVWMCFGILMIL